MVSSPCVQKSARFGEQWETLIREFMYGVHTLGTHVPVSSETKYFPGMGAHGIHVPPDK